MVSHSLPRWTFHLHRSRIPPLKTRIIQSKRFAWILLEFEHDFPLSRADLNKITPDILMTLSQEQVDQIYGRLTAGPIPDGLFRGDLFFTRGDTLSTRLEEILRWHQGTAGRRQYRNLGDARPRFMERKGF